MIKHLKNLFIFPLKKKVEKNMSLQLLKFQYHNLHKKTQKWKNNNILYNKYNK